jgi:hypothetical protein
MNLTSVSILALAVGFGMIGLTLIVQGSRVYREARFARAALAGLSDTILHYQHVLDRLEERVSALEVSQRIK